MSVGRCHDGKVAYMALHCDMMTLSGIAKGHAVWLHRRVSRDVPVHVRRRRPTRRQPVCRRPGRCGAVCMCAGPVAGPVDSARSGGAEDGALRGRYLTARHETGCEWAAARLVAAALCLPDLSLSLLLIPLSLSLPLPLSLLLPRPCDGRSISGPARSPPAAAGPLGSAVVRAEPAPPIVSDTIAVRWSCQPLARGAPLRQRGCQLSW